MQHALSFWSCLCPVDVGALIERLRAIDNRHYEFYRSIFEFCNRPFSELQHSKLVIFKFQLIANICAKGQQGDGDLGDHAGVLILDIGIVTADVDDGTDQDNTSINAA